MQFIRRFPRAYRHFQIEPFRSEPKGSRFQASPTQYVVVNDVPNKEDISPIMAHWVTDKADDGISRLRRTLPIDDLKRSIMSIVYSLVT